MGRAQGPQRQEHDGPSEGVGSQAKYAGRRKPSEPVVGRSLQYATAPAPFRTSQGPTENAPPAHSPPPGAGNSELWEV